MHTLPLISAAAALAPFFPSLLNWIAGKDGEKMAKHILDAAKMTTGQKDLSAITHIFQKNPEALLSFQKILKQMEQTHHMQHVTDRLSARERDMSFVQNGRKNTRADIMVIAAALGLVLCLISLALYKSALPGEAVGIISTIAGIFGACLKDAYAFEFGSSRGSKEKDWQVNHFLKQLP